MYELGSVASILYLQLRKTLVTLILLKRLRVEWGGGSKVTHDNVEQTDYSQYIDDDTKGPDVTGKVILF